MVPFMIASVSAKPDGTCEITLKTGERQTIDGMTAEQVIAHVHNCTLSLLTPYRPLVTSTNRPF